MTPNQDERANFTDVVVRRRRSVAKRDCFVITIYMATQPTPAELDLLANTLVAAKQLKVEADRRSLREIL
ncbi:TPA_asm: hypothetical protein [ssRNA phage Esthiorhiza.3_5]|jgi:hypothetical protein|uniref:Uncharacterized protein n=2 Tax=Leviviricetes TaxID=2842243 RepID=A0A8S5L3H2_9VIRU|nr:hypothetical protein QIP03_gp5 [ssRNA phage Esthiorhiza.3_5]QDH89661.1 MAG: hypothetical protein H3RhizoLitter14321_000002 [Leviviridae sp.]DAD51927.1 TPA_asm: hypothetical protein [ssRNA phage Esthiorhiza.3_5]